MSHAGIGEYARQWLLINRLSRVRRNLARQPQTHHQHRGSSGYSTLLGVSVKEGVRNLDGTGRCWKLETYTYEEVKATERRGEHNEAILRGLEKLGIGKGDTVTNEKLKAATPGQGGGFAKKRDQAIKDGIIADVPETKRRTFVRCR
jgi:hypothetical protein